MDPRRSRRSEKGGALIELALSLPLLVLVLFVTIDFARVFYVGIALTNAARAGAQYGAASLGRSGDIPGMEAAAIGSINTTGVTATASRTCQCANNAGTSFTVLSDCDATCPERRVITVTVQTTRNFSPATSIVSGIPGMPDPIVLTRTATLRVAE